MTEAPITAPEPRKEMPAVDLDEGEFKARFLSQYIDPAFGSLREELSAIAEAAWDGYANARKAPNTQKAGPGYADPAYDLAEDWIKGKKALERAHATYEDPARRPRVLVINGSSRSEHTCPGETSKSYRLAKIAERALLAADLDCELLDLSRLTSEYGRKIHPCKSCFSTAAALCHWPCSCYPNYSLGQTQDWMNEIYPMWVGADGILIVSPVNWYQASSPIKLMMDRLVCADGGNPDPTSTQGKDAKRAKEIELAGWHYPRHLKGRLYSVVVHGDVEGAENVRRSLSDWLRFMHLEPAGRNAQLDRYIGYWKPYATSHDELDADLAMQVDMRNAAVTLAEAVKSKRAGQWVSAGNDLQGLRQK